MAAAPSQFRARCPQGCQMPQGGSISGDGEPVTHSFTHSLNHLFVYKFKMYMGVLSAWPKSPEESTGPLELKLKTCKSPCGCWTHNQVIYKSSQRS